MKDFYRLFLLYFFLWFPGLMTAQDSLTNSSGKQKQPVNYAEETFTTSRVVIGQSIETTDQGNLDLVITHHFGALNTGYQNLFGLQQSVVRIGAEYGFTRWFASGFGLNTDRNTWDGFLKFKIFRQKSGGKKFPFTLSGFVNAAVFTTKWENPERKNYLSSRVSYCFQVLVARKFGERVSLQVMPSMVHLNLVPAGDDHNDIYTVGGGGRVKLSSGTSLNAEYHHVFPGQVHSSSIYDSFSVGFDIETGGHVFQIFLTNSTGEFEEAFLANTTGRWGKGGIFLGFNINRLFTIVSPRELRK